MWYVFSYMQIVPIKLMITNLTSEDLEKLGIEEETWEFP